MKKNKKRNKNVVVAEAPRNFLVPMMKEMTGKGAHKSKKAYNRKVGKKVDFS